MHGTWLGVTRQGRVAVLTNFRERQGSEAEEAARPSRGGLASGFLVGETEKENSNQSDDGGKEERGDEKGSGGKGGQEGDVVEQYARHLQNRRSQKHAGLDVGGYSLIFGMMDECGGITVGAGMNTSKGLGVLSNRAPPSKPLSPSLSPSPSPPVQSKSGHFPTRIATHPSETHILSNTHFGDQSWKKVSDGRHLLERAIAASEAGHDGKDALIERLFADVLSVDTFPARRETGDAASIEPRTKTDTAGDGAGRDSRAEVGEQVRENEERGKEGEKEEEEEEEENWQAHAEHLRDSIFIPKLGGENTNNKNLQAIFYGTQKQTVILLDRHRHVTFVERTLYDEHAERIPETSERRERRFEFDIED